LPKWSFAFRGIKNSTQNFFLYKFLLFSIFREWKESFKRTLNFFISLSSGQIGPIIESFVSGTRICIKCIGQGTKFPASKMADVSCEDLTLTPIRRFKIHHYCHGKLTFLSKAANQNCSCSHGLHYELIWNKHISYFTFGVDFW